MKRSAFVLAFILVFVLGIAFANAADVVLKNASITSAVQKIDKNGNGYSRFIVAEKRTVQGIQYDAEVPVMAFGELNNETAKSLKAGDKLSAICKSRTYQGSTYYTIIKWIQATQ